MFVFNWLIEPSFPLTGSNDVKSPFTCVSINESEAFLDSSTNETGSHANARDLERRIVSPFNTSLL